MLQCLYVALTIVNLFLFLLTQKRLSFLFIYFISSCVYYLDAIIGVSFNAVGGFSSGQFSTTPVDWKTYVLLIINMLCIFLFLLSSIIKGKKNQQEKKIIKEYYSHKKIISEKYAIRLLIIIDILIALFNILPTIFSSLGSDFNKAELLEEASSVTSYYKSIATFLAIYIFTQDRIKYSVVDYVVIVLLLLLTLLLGHRSYLVIALIAIAVVKINRNKNETVLFKMIGRNWKKVLLVIICFLCFIFSKNIYTALFNGNLDLVKTRLSDISYYTDSFKENEFNTIFVNLDTTVRQGYSYPLSTYIKRTSLVFLPIASRFVEEEPFSSKFQRELFGANYRASTFIGESYASGGVLLSIIVMLFVIMMLMVFERRIGISKNNVLKTFFIISAVDIAFYVHRNSIEYSLIRIRSYLYILILVYVFYLIINRMAKDER